MTYSVGLAYVLWFVGGLGTLGLHRFYLGRPVSGLFFIFTGGFFFVGSVLDFLRMESLVREANLHERYRQALLDRPVRARVVDPRPQREKHRPESMERVILRTARANEGIANPGEVALEADVAVEKARDALEQLCAKGFAQMRVRENGSIFYYFPEFDAGEPGRGATDASI